MRVLLSIATVALVAAAQDPAEPANPAIVLQMPNAEPGDNVTISWDGADLLIPQHTDRLDAQEAHLGVLDTNVSVIKRTLFHLEAKLNETNELLVSLTDRVSKIEDVITNHDGRIVENENDIADNIQKIKNRACTRGKYRNSQGFCTACAAGKYQNELGQTTCKNCAGGKYQQFTGRTLCGSCPGGKYQNQAGQSSCKSCLGTGKYDYRAGRTSCGYTCGTCNTRTHWYQQRCKANANRICKSKWTQTSSTRPCSWMYGSTYGSESSAQTACISDGNCKGISYVQNAGSSRRRWIGGSHRRRYSGYKKCKTEGLASQPYANRRRRRRSSTSSWFKDYDARPCELTGTGATHCPTWN